MHTFIRQMSELTESRERDSYGQKRAAHSYV